MILTAIAALGSAAASAYGAYKSSQANKAAQDKMTDLNNRNQQYYLSKALSDYTNRTDFQSLMQKQRDLLSEQYRRARATNVVSGGTDESLAIQKDLANNSLASSMSSIASGASDYKDSMESAAIQANNNYMNAMADMDKARANNIAAASGQATQAFSQIAANDQSTLKDDWSKLSSVFKKG